MNAPVVDKLLGKGVEVDSKDFSEGTSLHLVSKIGHMVTRKLPDS